MSNKFFNGNKLKVARLFNGISLTDLANKTGISKQLLSLYENKKNVPDYSKMFLLAQNLNFPIDYFFTEDTFIARTDTTYFRSQSTATKRERISQSVKLEHVAEIYEVLNYYLEFPSYNDPQIDFKGYDSAFENISGEAVDEIENVTDRLRNCWNIPNAPIINLQNLLEQNGILVTGFKTDGNKIDAFSQRTVIDGLDVYIIAIDLGKQSDCRIRFDMAHELGHILLHPWSEDIESISKEEFKNRERQANMFASALLLPRESFSRDLKNYPTSLKYYQFLKQRWGVSIQAMIMRAYQLEYITENQYQYLMRQVSRNGWRLHEPGDSQYDFGENIFQNAIKVLFDNKIFNSTTLMMMFKDKGVCLYPQTIEKLLHLPDGMLKDNVQKDNIDIAIKNN